MPHIFKNGGTTVIRTVQKHVGHVYSTYINDLEQQDVIHAFGSHMGFKAALVRDPLQRAASSFHEVMSRGHCKNDKSVLRMAWTTNQAELVPLFTKHLNYNGDLHFA